MGFMSLNHLEIIARLVGFLLHSFQLEGDVMFTYKVTRNEINN